MGMPVQQYWTLVAQPGYSVPLCREYDMISIIAAVARNRVIGQDGTVPWHIPADLRRFRELTMGHTILMGRKTFESIGKPLPGRRCVVLTRHSGYTAAGCMVAGSIAEALTLCGEAAELFVAGGADLYAQTLPIAGRLYISHVDIDAEGDTRFPEIPMHEFSEVRRELLSMDPPCTLIVYERHTCRDGAH